jgi:hypothetical protein
VLLAQQEYSGTVKWRRDEQIDTLRTQTLAQEDVYNTHWPCNIYGTDSHGHLLVVERTQEIDPAQLKAQMPMDLCLQHR